MSPTWCSLSSSWCLIFQPPSFPLYFALFYIAFKLSNILCNSLLPFYLFSDTEKETEKKKKRNWGENLRNRFWFWFQGCLAMYPRLVLKLWSSCLSLPALWVQTYINHASPEFFFLLFHRYSTCAYNSVLILGCLNEWLARTLTDRLLDNCEEHCGPC